MRMIAQHRRYARAAHRRASEQGLTLIELLLSLAILAVLTGFLASGLSTGRRAFDADRVSGIGSETDAAIQAISAVIGSALPVRAEAAVMFDGRQASMLLVGLSEGRSLRGGPHKIALRQNGENIIVDVMTSNNNAPSVPGVVVLRGVREIHFGYFGRTNPSTAPIWRTEWFGLDHLPDLVSVRIDFNDERRNQPATIVALRQG